MRRRNFVFRLIKVRDVWWEFICGSRKVILGREMTCTNVWLEPRQRRVTTLSGVFVNGLSSRRSSPVRDESRHGNPGYCTCARTGREEGKTVTIQVWQDQLILEALRLGVVI